MKVRRTLRRAARPQKRRQLPTPAKPCYRNVVGLLAFGQQIASGARGSLFMEPFAMCQTSDLEGAVSPSTLPDAKDRTRPLFPLGRIVATPGALAVLEENDLNPFEYLGRHQCGDWGSVPPEDWKSNDEALIHGGRVLSAYMVKGTKLWIITEWARSATTLLLPREY